MSIQSFLYSFANFGYVGAFLVSFFGNMSIIVNVPFYAVIFSMGAFLNPFWLGFFAAAGAAIGEFFSYLLGSLSKSFVKDESNKWFKLAKKWFHKSAALTIILFAITPLPDDVVGILSGVYNYDKKKYLLATFVGKLIMSWALAYGGKYSYTAVLDYFGG